MQWVLAYACYISTTRRYINIRESRLNLKLSKIHQSMEDKATIPYGGQQQHKDWNKENKVLVTTSAGFMTPTDH